MFTVKVYPSPVASIAAILLFRCRGYGVGVRDVDVSCKAVIVLAEKFFFHLCSFRSRAIVFRNAGQDVYLESDFLVLLKKI